MNLSSLTTTSLLLMLIIIFSHITFASIYLYAHILIAIFVYYNSISFASSSLKSDIVDSVEDVSSSPCSFNASSVA